MKPIIIFQFSILLLISCNLKNNKDHNDFIKNTKNYYDSAFVNYYNKFNTIDLPYSFNIKTYVNNMGYMNREIKNSYVECFIEDIKNQTYFTYSSDSIKYKYWGRFSGLDKKQFFSVIYFIEDCNLPKAIHPKDCDRKLVLVTYSKDKIEIISKLVLFAIDDGVYNIYSSVNNDLDIEIYYNYFFLDPNQPYKLKNGIALPNSNYKSYFVLNQKIDKYKINDYGEIIAVELGEIREYIAKFNPNFENGLEYPIDLPLK